MKPVLILACKEMKKKLLYTLTLVLITTVSMLVCLFAVTDSGGLMFQKKALIDTFHYPMENILRLQYHSSHETYEFIETEANFRTALRDMEGVIGAGRFDVTSIEFEELKNNSRYQELNKQYLENNRSRHPEISRLIKADQSLLSMVDIGVSKYPDLDGLEPVYVSDIYSDVIAKGDQLTDTFSKTRYEVVGYFSAGSKWVSGDDIIRYPTISMDGMFLVPFSEYDNQDVMSSLSCLHNTYVLLDTNTDIYGISDAISEIADDYGLQVTAVPLENELAEYTNEVKQFAINRFVLAVFIVSMTVCSIVLTFVSHTIMKKKQYGVLLANGYAMKDVTLCIVGEICMTVFSSAALAWLIQFLSLYKNDDLFREIYLLTHCTYGTSAVITIAVVITVLSSVLPIAKIKKCTPSELIGGTK